MAKNQRKGSAPLRPASSAARPSRSIAPGWISSNWSGYAISGRKNAYRQISAYWVVPQVKPSKQDRFSSAWIGIDGFENPFLIQTGTEHDTINGKTVYYPWWEILPAPETRINRPVSPGDLIFAQIRKLPNRKWLILLRNKTKGWTFKTIQRYAGPAATAEWVMEAPSIGSEITTLANYGKIRFYSGKINRHSANLKPRNRGIMIQQGRIVSTPSLPNKTKNGFYVAYGSRLPKPPRCKR